VPSPAPAETRAAASLLGLRGVGQETAKKLAALEIRTPADLATTYPRDYKDWRYPVEIAHMVRTALSRTRASAEAESFEEIALGTIRSLREFRARIPVVSAEIEDDTGRMRATWFGRRGFSGKLSVGDRVFVHGRVALKRSRASGTVVEMNVLHHRVLREGEEYHGAIVPVYPAGKEMPSRAIAALIERNREALASLLHEALPAEIERKHGYGPLREAWRTVHWPTSPAAAQKARERLLFEQFFALALAAALKRARRDASGGAPPIPQNPELLRDFERALPFALTGAQRREIAAISADMSRTAPMNRLLQGDVGSGKTVVAASAVLLAARAGLQSALMAPTEILAAQHARQLAPLLLPFGVRVDVLFANQGARSRAEARARLESGECELAVGTHALLTEDVTFANLGLAIIDEQQRFGVLQRARLRAKSTAPHTLYMTATPIPRTLAQVRYADLDLSTIDEMPPGRTPIKTFVVRESRKPRAYEFIRRNVELGRQAYVVAPAIDGPEEGDETDAALTSAVEEFARLRTGPLGSLRIALLHGRMPPREKDDIMERFGRGEIDVLLATTVVEVGVDVANATVMVVLDAHRYGLAQLHQLRGRVGRGAAESYCILITPDDKHDVERLEILSEESDGFRIAEEDLRLRHAGEFAGTAQAGGEGGLLGDVARDFSLYMRAKADADAVVAADPALASPENARLLTLLDESATARAMLLSS
jgi:ATP-dependent DNA helicase RecG